MTLIAFGLYALGALMMMCLADIELRATPAVSQRGKGLTILVASLIWPLVMLYTVVATSVDLAIMGLRSLFSPTK